MSERKYKYSDSDVELLSKQEVLRLNVGDYVLKEKEPNDSDFEIICISEDDLVSIVLQEKGYRSCLAGIPTTKEWLLKLGLHEMVTKRNHYLKTVNGEMSIDSEDFIFNLKEKFVYEDIGTMVIPIGRQVQYVHELQNAYFVKYGEELTPKN